MTIPTHTPPSRKALDTCRTGGPLCFECIAPPDEPCPVTAPTCSPPADLPPATASEDGMNRPTYADGPAGGDDGRGTA